LAVYVTLPPEYEAAVILAMGIDRPGFQPTIATFKFVSFWNIEAKVYTFPTFQEFPEKLKGLLPLLKAVSP